MIVPHDDNNRHVLITGATGGIGSALTKQFADAGFHVSAVGRNRSALAELARLGECIAPIEADMADRQAAAEAFAQARAAHGPVSHIIAAAAIYPKAHFLDEGAEQLEQALRVNVVGVANTLHEGLPEMLERNFGRNVVFGSLADLNPLPGSIAYSVSKGALHSLVRGIAGEIDRVRYPNVLVNEFNPGATRTAMSTHGRDPAEIFELLTPLIACDADGPHGRFYQEGREVRIGESWKAALKRVVLRR
ncbi:SDR family NAD(P)-dependent oxidoreductase [Aurantiacibacter poecillastricola]|uniref:SDR family NAD(P)-dependent oxidoreductase n=1 Tax=Aurantiacibacter poecillastricola TaxID=3064385 RepID=UPI00273F9034|nr:SDR family oxidoreductase [Aurantiacibacter sp. 219JJ12-13]MDP5260712.1 SDR family oxidoreductase [Aurantiacibacter sp. 219JJ12-13]